MFVVIQRGSEGVADKKTLVSRIIILVSPVDQEEPDYR